jgi:potassium efflux system protein
MALILSASTAVATGIGARSLGELDIVGGNTVVIRRSMNHTPAPSSCTRLRCKFSAVRASTRLTLLVSLIVLVFVAGQAGAQSRVIVVPQDPTVSEADKRLAESASILGESERAAVVEIYREARELLLQAESEVEQTRKLRDEARGAAQTVNELQARLNSAVEVPDAKRYQSRALDDLQTDLRKLRTERDQLQLRLSEERAKVEALSASPKTLRESYSAAQSSLEKELTHSEPAPVQDAQAISRARVLLFSARRRALAASAERLRTETQSLDDRLALATARRDLLTRDLGMSQAAIKVLESAVGNKQASEAQSSRRLAQIAEAKVQDQHPVVQLAASQNTAFADELASVVNLQSDLARQLAAAEQRLQRLEGDYQGAQQRVALAGLSSALGQVLREQRRVLPNLRSVRGKAREREGALVRVGLAQLRIEEAIQQTVDPVAYSDELIRQSLTPDAVPIDAVLRRELNRQLASLLADRRDALQKLSSTYQAQLKLLSEVEFAEQRLVRRADEYAAFLGEKLLWIPSTRTLDLQTLQGIGPAALWLIHPSNLAQLAVAGKEQIIDRPLALMLLLIGVWVLVRVRRRLLMQLANSAQAVRDVYSDRFTQTLRCCGATLLLAMPAALAVAFVGSRLAAHGAGDTYVYAVAGGLSAVAMPLFLLRLFRYIYAVNGLGVAHFRWSAASAARMRRYLNVLACVLLPGLFFVRAMEAQPDGDFQASLGRCAFIVLVLAIAWMNHRVFHPSNGVLLSYLRATNERWIGRLRHLWYSMAVGIPLSIGALAAFGYYYTALRLHENQIATIRLIIGSVLLFHLILRALVVARRKLALSKTHAQPTTELSADGSPVQLNVPNIDINTIDTQTRNLARVLISWTAVIGLYLIWADVLPALVVLDEVVLWDSTSIVDGVNSVQHVTLANLCLALVFGIVFAVAARNLPGVLEIVVLQRLPVDAGSRYAITALSQYLIVTFGFIFIIQSLGVGWGQVQWLVAAVGVGLGFGLQEIFANFVSGIIILFERPVRIGDTVTLGELTGTVSRIRIRATTITDWDNKEIIIPNKSFITDKLINWTLSDSILRVVIPIGVAYGTDTRLAHEVIWNVAKSNARVLREPQLQVFFLGFGESSLDFELRVFVGELADKLKVTHELHMDIIDAFNAHGIEIPFPQRDVHIRSTVSSSVEVPLKTIKGDE